MQASIQTRGTIPPAANTFESLLADKWRISIRSFVSKSSQKADYEEISKNKETAVGLDDNGNR